MSGESLEDRLRSHAKAFDGLLQLIPAKHYYGEDTSDQWQRKKQTKEQKRQAKLAKLDPENSKSAKDVMDENNLKRKREEEEVPEVEGVELEKPMQGLKKSQMQSKKQKRDNKAIENISTGDATTSKKTEGEKRREKRERRKAKEQAKGAKLEAKKAKKQQTAEMEGVTMEDTGAAGESEGDGDPRTGDIDRVDIRGILDEPQKQPPSTATPSPAPQSPPFDVSTAHSGSSSISSIAPPTTAEDPNPEKPTKQFKLPKTDPDELKARLQLRIDALRAARKADGLHGGPAKNRQELMDARRRKEEQRRAHKKELRQKAKEEEDRQRQLTIFRGSPLLSPASGSNALPSPLREANNFSFGRIAFSNTQIADPTLSTTLSLPKRKGPQDPHTALEAAEKKKSRIAALDDATRTDIEAKDLWLNARKRAHGERVRDDTSLLKKTLKRKEKLKKKSETEWGERIEGVQKSQAMRQKKREENLAKRRDEKGSKGGKKKGGSGGKKGGAKKRPGFEGSFRARGPGGK